MDKTRYVSYLLRLWQTTDDQEQVWHASLECLISRQRYGFARLEDLLGFLQDQIRVQEEQS